MAWNRFTVTAAAATGLAIGGPLLLGSAPSAGRQGEALASSRLPSGRRCVGTRLRLTAGPLVSEKTEQSTRVFVLRNTGATSCVLRGYPTVTLLDGHGRVLPFRYRHDGDQELTGAGPRSVRLPRRGDAYVALNKNTCVTRDRGHAARLELMLPRTVHRLTLRLAALPLLAYCARGDPGHTVDVTPIEPSPRALWSRPSQRLIPR